MLFLGLKSGEKGNINSFFKKQPIRRNDIAYIILYLCSALGIRGGGVAKYMTAHGLRATMI